MKQFFTDVIFLLRLIFLAVGVFYIWQQDWIGVFVVTQAIVISFLPYLLRKFYDIRTPFSLRAGIVIFMCFALLLGEIAQFYTLFWWWDLLLHFLASIGLTLIGFISLLVLFRKADIQSTPFFTVVLAFSFSLTFAVLWEVYEFGIDYFLDPEIPMQVSNTDTMTDLLAMVLGSMMVGVFGYRYIRGDRINAVSQIIDEGAATNN